MDLNKNRLGQFFTPDYIAEFMVKNIKQQYFSTHNEFSIDKIKILEPSAGKGIFLNYILGEGFTNITAYELDQNLKTPLLKNYPNVKLKFENFLGSDPNEQFDIIIGNPPYLGQNYNAEIFQNFVKIYPVCAHYFVGNMDLFYYFIHLGIIKLKPRGLLSFVTTNYWITKSKKTGIKLLKPHILNECYLLQYIDLSRLTIFKDATGQHNCIFVLQKKTQKEKLDELNRKINIIQVKGSKSLNQTNNTIFEHLAEDKNSPFFIKYQSALTNSDLNKNDSWNLIYPEEVKKVVNKIEENCSEEGKILLMKDYFLIRNGLILIKDEIFILKVNKNLKFDRNEVLIKIGSNFIKLNEDEKRRLKKVYKSKSIRKYGFEVDDFYGFILYFNKEEFNFNKEKDWDINIENKYPALVAYLKQDEEALRNILINAKENPNDLFFPRRGSFILKNENESKFQKINLESFYDHGKKIFFKYISDSNIFGYSNSSYYATSDTYFLWPKKAEEDIDYLFIIAYLNSKIVYFLFKAKNISIKRSKTKLEYNLPIPNINKFRSEKALFNIELIKLLAGWLIELNNFNNRNTISLLMQKFIHIRDTHYFKNKELLEEIEEALNSDNINALKRVIDILFFQLFNLDEKRIDFLIQKYYKLSFEF